MTRMKRQESEIKRIERKNTEQRTHHTGWRSKVRVEKTASIVDVVGDVVISLAHLEYHTV